MNSLDAPSSFDVRIYSDILLRRKKMILIAFALCLVAGSYFAITSKPSFRVTASVLMREIDLEYNTMKRMGPRVGANEDLDLLRAKIMSPAVLGELIDRTELAQDSAIIAEAKKKHRAYATLTLAEIQKTILVEKLKTKILSIKTQGDNILQFSAEHQNPETAYRLVKTLVEIFIEHSRRTELVGLESGLKYSEGQLEIYKKNLETAEARLQRFKSGAILNKYDSKVGDDQYAAQLRELVAATSDQLDRENRILQNSPAPRDGTTPEALSIASIDRLHRQQLGKLDQMNAVLQSSSYSSESLDRINSDLQKLDLALEAEVESAAVTAPASERPAWITREMAKLRIQFFEKKKKVTEQLLTKYLSKRKTSLVNEPLQAMTEEKLTEEVEQARQLYTLSLQQKQGTEMEAALQSAKSSFQFRILEPAQLPLSSNSMSKGVIMLIACGLGLGLSLALAFGLEGLDRSFKNVEDVQTLTRLPVVGLMPKLEEQTLRFDLEVKDALEIQRVTEHLLESLRVRSRMAGDIEIDQAPIVLVTSSVAGEGKSSFAARLALSTSLLKREGVLLIDADLRRPSLHRLLKVENRYGLANLIENKGESLEICLIPTETRRLFVLPSGRSERGPLELVSSVEFGKILRQLSEAFAFIIIDAPPVIPVNDALMICKNVNSILYLVKAGATPRQVVRRGIDLVRNAGGPPPGIIINNLMNVLPYHYRREYYQYEYEFKASTAS